MKKNLTFIVFITVIVLLGAQAIVVILIKPPKVDMKLIGSKIVAKTIHRSLKRFYRYCGRFPDEKEGAALINNELKEVVKCKLSDGQLRRISYRMQNKDAFENKFQYRIKNAKPILVSSGSDGKFDTEDDYLFPF